MERRVVSQLALAHERQLIQKGCSVRITTGNRKDNGEVTKSADATLPGETKKGEVPVIRLQVIQKGKLKDKVVDLDLESLAQQAFS